MTWTTTPPTKPGYYWWRNSKTKGCIVFVDGQDVRFAVNGLVHHLIYLCGEWYGPLEEPKE